jgi:hypothetical protein
MKFRIEYSPATLSHLEAWTTLLHSGYFRSMMLASEPSPG